MKPTDDVPNRMRDCDWRIWFCLLRLGAVLRFPSRSRLFGDRLCSSVWSEQHMVLSAVSPADVADEGAAIKASFAFFTGVLGDCPPHPPRGPNAWVVKVTEVPPPQVATPEEYCPPHVPAGPCDVP
mmetsp:Transcript_3740/g.7772  ORF Transcript_3740/g.7772 Transcript_3740/m.7772 type:complete len:126 (+) Transcript_3740:380-757(+)